MKKIFAAVFPWVLLFVSGCASIANSPDQQVRLASQNQVRVPKDDDRHRFIAPGKESSVLNLALEITPEALGLKTKFSSSIDSLKASEPNYLWQGTTRNLDAGYLRDPNDATERRSLYIFGLDNAKRWAYLSLMSGRNYLQANIFNGRKYYLAKPISYNDASFYCLSFSTLPGFMGNRTAQEEKIRSGDWWFTCSAQLTLFFYEGQPLR